MATSVDEQNQNGHIQTLTELLSVLFIVALLFLTFRALLAPLVALLPSAVALVAAGPIIAESTHLGVQVSDLTPILLIVVLLGAGTDYGLFLIFRLREELRRGKDVHEAVAFSLCKVGESITFSGLTVIGALATVVVATLRALQGTRPGPGHRDRRGPAGQPDPAAGPAGRARPQRVLAPDPRGRPRTRAGPGAGSPPRWWDRPVLTLVIGLVIFGGLALSMLAYSPNGFNDPPAPATSDSGRGQAILTADFPSVRDQSHHRGVPAARLGLERSGRAGRGPAGPGPLG